jgi:hypothetical protein
MNMNHCMEWFQLVQEQAAMQAQAELEQRLEEARIREQETAELQIQLEHTRQQMEVNQQALREALTTQQLQQQQQQQQQQYQQQQQQQLLLQQQLLQQQRQQQYNSHYAGHGRVGESPNDDDDAKSEQSTCFVLALIQTHCSQQ